MFILDAKQHDSGSVEMQNLFASGLGANWIAEKPAVAEIR
jgi:hypothetical protein